MEDDDGDVFEEDAVTKYFQNYHAPAILSKVGKVVVLIFFSGLFAFGDYGAMDLSVEDSTRNLIPEGSYLQDYFAAADEFFPSKGIDLYNCFTVLLVVCVRDLIQVVCDYSGTRCNPWANPSPCRVIHCRPTPICFGGSAVGRIK